jgi:hypothetical protein
VGLEGAESLSFSVHLTISETLQDGAGNSIFAFGDVCNDVFNAFLPLFQDGHESAWIPA